MLNETPTSAHILLAQMQAQLGNLVPAIELAVKAEQVMAIQQLKRERNAVILGHNYMEPALYQTVCDFKGDSLELARAGTKVSHPVLVFCGVAFMAETAKILSPEKTVLLPALKAGCSLAASITAEDVRELKKQFPGVPVVTYVNTYADVKAESDVCVTSSNAAQIVEALNVPSVIFLPDEYLAKNVARETGRHIILPTKDPRGISKEDEVQRVLVGWGGKCEVHEQFSVADIENVRKQFPDVVVLAHPECKPEVVEAADFSGSTAKMIAYVKSIQAPRYLLLTECSMGDNIIAENPDKNVLRLCSVRCPHMNQITLQQTLDSLKYLQYKVEIDEGVRVKAKRALDKMLALS